MPYTFRIDTLRSQRLTRSPGPLALVCAAVFSSSAWIGPGPVRANAPLAEDPAAIVQNAVDYYRDSSSYGDVTMTIRRRQWERTMRVEVWTRGKDDSLLRINEPAKDRGTSTLRRGDELWTYSPKVSRLVKLPPSMMEQSWMGSDFSNNDLSKTESLVRDYRHRHLGTESSEGHLIHMIEAVPLPGAPVVWGKQVLKIRDDHIVTGQAFFDERGKLVKEMAVTGIQTMGGKLFPQTWKMSKADKPEEYTTLFYHTVAFGRALREAFFSPSNLSNPRQ
jgi:outer membrane lipoprotein-sorting protein